MFKEGPGHSLTRLSFFQKIILIQCFFGQTKMEFIKTNNQFCSAQDVLNKTRR
jgi:hypothetical protein